MHPLVRPRTLLACALLTVPLITGCSQLAEDIATHLEARDVKAYESEFTIFEADLALFRTCLKKRGGSCEGSAATALPHTSGEGTGQGASARSVLAAAPGSSQILAKAVGQLGPSHPAATAYTLLTHPVVQQAADLHGHLRGHNPSGTAGTSVENGKGVHGGPQSTVTMDVKFTHLDSFHTGLLSSIGNNGWEALGDHCTSLVAKHKGDHRLAAECRRVAFIRGYLEAYLRKGQFITVEVGLDGALQVIDRDGKKLTKLDQGFSEIDTDLVHEINKALGAADHALSNVFRVTNVGFVSRDNTFRARLPSIEVTFDPTARRMWTVTDTDTGQILTTHSQLADLGVAQDTSGVGTGANLGAELARVFFEALFDAHEGLPAVAPIGGVEATGLRLGPHSLPLFRSPMGHVDSQDFTKMTRLNDQVGLQARLIAGRIISGFGPLNLNNPPLENLFAEIIATSVRKAAAKATWCWYSCNLNTDLHALETDAKTALDDKAKAEEKNVKTWSRNEAEHVKLRFRIRH